MPDFNPDDFQEGEGPLIPEGSRVSQRNSFDPAAFEEKSAPVSVLNLPLESRESPFQGVLEPTLRSLPAEQGFDTEVRLSGGDIKSALKNWKGLTPDKAAQVARYAREKNLSYTGAETMREQMEADDEIRSIYDEFNATNEDGTPRYPGTANWLKDPVKMMASRDDLAALKELEEIIRYRQQKEEGLAPWLSRVLGVGTLELAKYGLAIPAATYEGILSHVPTAPMGFPFPEEKTKKQEMEDRAPEWLRNFFGFRDYLGKKVEGLRPPPSKDPITAFHEEGFFGMLKSIPAYTTETSASMVPAIIASYLTRSPNFAMGALAAMSGGVGYDEAVAEGKTPRQASEQAALYAATEAFFEATGTFGILKEAERLTKRDLKTILDFAGRSFVRGGLSEGLTQISQQMADTYTGDPQGMKNVVGNTINATLAGAFGDTMITVPAGLTHNIFTNQLVTRAEANAQNFDELVQQVSKTKLQSRDSELLAQVLTDQIRQAGRPETASVESEKVLTYFQGNVNEYYKFAEAVGVTREEAERALKGGADIEISTAKFAAKYANDKISSALRNDIRFTQGGLTVNETKLAQEQVKQMLAGISEDLKDLAPEGELPTQIAQMREALINFKDDKGRGFSAADVDSMLLLTLARAKISADQRGISVPAWFNLWGLKLDAKARVRKARGGVWEIVPEGFKSPQERFSDDLKGQRTFLAQKARDAGLATPNKASKEQTTAWAKEWRTFNPLYQEKDEGPPRGALQITKGKTVISLFEAADYSTFLHESGHLFLADLADVVESGMGGKQAAKDLKILRDFAGAKGDAAFTVEQEEKVARGFEAYLREGKAPSVGLAGAFFRFKAWLMALYRVVSKLDVKINDEVRGVFDRMLASEQDLAAARAFYNEKQSLLDLIQGEDERVAALREKKKVAEQTESEKQVSAYLRAYLRAVGGRQAVREEVRKMVESEPVWQAIDKAMLGGIDPASAESVMGEPGAAALSDSRPGIIREHGAVTFEGLAAEFGFENGVALANAIFNTPSLNEALDKGVADTMGLQEALIKKDLAEQGVTEADGALHSDASLAYLVAETQLLKEQAARAKKTPVNKISAEAIKAAAREYLSSLTVSRATNYSIFARAEKRLAGEVLAAARAGNWEEAARLRDKQLLQHVLVRESMAARTERMALERRYSPSRINSLLKGVEAAYRPPIEMLLHNYGFLEGAMKDPFDMQRVRELDEDGTLDALVPPWIKNSEFTGDYKTLTWGQLNELDDTIKILSAYGRSAMLSLKEGEEKTLREFADKSVGLMSELKDKKVSQKSEPFNYYTMKFADFLKSGVQMTQYAAEIADGFKFLKDGVAGPMRRLYHRMVKANLNQQKMMGDTLKAAAPAWRTLYDAVRRIEKERKAKYFDIPGLPLPEAMRLASKGQWTGEMLVSALLNLGNQGNFEALKNGYKFTDGFEQLIAQNFTAKELQAVQGIWDATNMLWPQLAEEHFRIYNTNLDKVEGQPIALQAAEGLMVSLNGRYYPLIFDHEINARAGQFNEEDLMKNRASAVFHKTKPKDGMTISRIGSQLPPNLSLGVWATHINDTTRYITHAAVVRDFNRVTLDEAWREAFIRKMGASSYEALRDWLKYQAVPRRLPSNAWVRGADKVADWTRSRATVAILGLKLKTGLMQRTALINSAVALGGWEWIGEGYKSMGTKGLGTAVLGRGNNEMWQMIVGASDYMRLREENIDRDISDAVGRIEPGAKVFSIAGKEFTVRDLQDAAFEWIKMNDRSTVSVVWSGAYQKYAQTIATPEMTPEQKHTAAAEYADMIVSETQPSSLKAELSAFGRQEGWLRFFTAFMTWSMKYGNRLLFMNKAWREGAISNKDYFSHVFHEVFAEPWTRTILYAAMAGNAPDWWQYLMAPIENLLSWIPILRDVPRNMAYGSEFFNLNRMVPAAEGPKRAGKVYKSAADLVTGDGDFWQFSKDLGSMTTFTLGIPADNVVKDISGVYDMVSSEADQKKETDKRGIR